MKIRIFTFLILFGGFLCLIPNQVFAEKINNYDVSVIANQDGSMDVKEKINYDFEDIYKHGIFRDIPLSSKVGNLYRNIKIIDIKVERDGQSEKFVTSKDSNNLNIKIGNPNKTISGAHGYIVSYKILNGIGSNFSDHDEIYFNGTGNYWEVPIENATLSLRTYGPNIEKSKCFTSPNPNDTQNCEIDPQIPGLARNTATLSSSEGLTAIYSFPLGSFPKSELSKNPPGNFITNTISNHYLDFVSIIWIVPNLIVAPLLLVWAFGKRKKILGPPAVNFDIPKGKDGEIYRPAIVGTVDNGKVDKNDITATIFDLAIRKYIKLEEEKSEKKFGVFGSDKKQKIIKLREKDEKMNLYEKSLYGKLFAKGDTVYVEDLKKDFGKTYKAIEGHIFSTLRKEGLYNRNPRGMRFGIFIVAVFALFFNFNVILAIVICILAIVYSARTQKGDEVDHKIEGLKLFLKSMDRNYKWQSKNFYTVEQMIPYAIALGYIDEFMKQLKIINPDYNPSWYTGGNFYYGYSGFYTSIGSNITTVAPSSSSGFSSGGGFSGGGVGGGGGGSW